MDHRLELVKFLVESKKKSNSIIKKLNTMKARYLATAVAHHLGWDENYDTNDKEADIANEDGLTGEIKWSGATDKLTKGVHYYHAPDLKWFDRLPDMKSGQEISSPSKGISHAKKSKNGRSISISLENEKKAIKKLLSSRTVHVIGNPSSVHVVVSDPESHSYFANRTLTPTIDPTEVTRGGRTSLRIRGDSSAGGSTVSRRLSLNANGEGAKQKAIESSVGNADAMHRGGSFQHALEQMTISATANIKSMRASGNHETADEIEEALKALTSIHHEHSRAHERRSKKSNK